MRHAHGEKRNTVGKRTSRERTICAGEYLPRIPERSGETAMRPVDPSLCVTPGDGKAARFKEMGAQSPAGLFAEFHEYGGEIGFVLSFFGQAVGMADRFCPSSRRP